MGFRINTNIAALNSHTAATMNNRSLDNSLSKLSSGLRINKAADDASGLAIANSLKSQASSLAQAVSNGNDAIGLIQTADGALNEYSNILDTIKTKAVQAASDGQNSVSRLAIQKDIDRLLENLNNISKTTSFNGQKLLSGTFTNKEFQMGSNANETIKASIGSTETNQIGQTTQARLDIQGEGVNQLTLISGRTGESFSLEPVEILSNNKPANGMGAVADQINKYSADTGITAKAVVSVTTDTIAAGATGLDFKINGVLIGAINVAANDKDGTLLNAINKKTNETGVIATKNQDGTLALSSRDGRAIETTGDISGIGSTTVAQLSTIGYLEVSQAGSSTFQIKGADNAAAVGEDLVLDANTSMNAIQDSKLAVGSKIASGSIIAKGSVTGAKITVTVATFGGDTATTAADGKLQADGTLAVGSMLNSGSTIAKGTTLTSTVVVRATTATAALDTDMLVKAGSTLLANTKFDAGTVLQQDVVLANDTVYKAGTTLTSALTLTKDLTVTKDFTIKRDAATSTAVIADGSTLLAGTVLGVDVVTDNDSTLAADMTIKVGSIINIGSTIAVGSAMGDNILVDVTAGLTTTTETDLKVGSTLASGSTIAQGSTVGGAVKVGSAGLALTNGEDMLLKAGSMIKLGSTIKAGTILQQDLTAAQAGNSSGTIGLSAGTVVGTDIVTQADIELTKDMVFLRGDSQGGYGKLLAGSIIAANAQEQNSVALGEEEFTNLSDINVTTLKGAMRAISTLEAAITDLDTIRSDLGSVQNQLVSTINNISVTQVNVKSAESQIRDVDFAAESAAFSKFNILAQSGSYAMSQANAVQQNVLRLLQ